MGRSQRERLSSAIIWTERNRSRRSVSRMRKRRRQLLIRSPRSEPLQRTAKKKIERARQLYNDASAEQREYVTNYEVLTAAEEAYQSLKK